MLDTYVSMRLNNWGAWVVRREDSGLGYPKQVSYTNLMPRTGASNHTPEFAEECFETERCVMALRVMDEHLYAVVVMAYVHVNMTVEQKVKKLGCSTQTYYNKIEMAHRRMLGLLNDLACGIELPKPDVKRFA